MAIRVATAQMKNVHLQPQPSSTAKGTLIPAPTPEQIDIVVVNTPVIVPILSGKKFFIIAGINTFPKAIPAPINAVPKSKPGMPAKDLRVILASIVIIPSSNA
ncbi:hypothetical protein SDC9_177871 [bioreactor metagenome]|uniref:Uncharacterized protein n=1 Tax=bioreactor metagenome TaxID=1076179 RepID=A0A645GVN3_9ZZZZ